MDDSDLPRRPSRRMLPAIVLAATVLVVGAVAVVSLQFGGHGAFPGAASSSPSPLPRRAYGYVCADLDEQTCARQAKDYGLRQELTPAQRKQAETAADHVEQVLGSVSADNLPTYQTCEPNGGPCSYPDKQPPFTEADVQRLRTALSRAGITNAVVRIAGRDDLEPMGTIEYAIPAGPGCDLGYMYGLSGGGSHTESGTYPDGSCLRQK